MNKENLKELKYFIESFSKVCYIAGKVEGQKGIEEDRSGEVCDIPENVFEKIMEEIDPGNKSDDQELGFTFPTVKIKEPIKVEITEDKEKELIKKFGKKSMEKLAKEMDFHGKILNKVKTK